MSEQEFKPLPEKSLEENVIRMGEVIQELAEQKMNLQIDLAVMTEAYKLQEEELNHFRNLATPEQRQVYRIIKQN
jgi:hypothetical protein